MLPHEIAAVESGNKVGLFRRDDGRCVLQVPFGMEHLSPVRALALLYRSLIVFRRTRRSIKRLSALDGVEEQPDDGLESGEGEVLFYDALALDELFDRVDPHSVLSLCDHRSRTSHDVYRRVDRHLHRALFDADDAIYLDRVPDPRRIVRYDRADIVGLYCFLALDFHRNFLNIDIACSWGSFSAEGLTLADDFQHRYLTPEDSLYLDDPERCAQSRAQMRHLLHVIDRASPVRSAQYRELHDALYRYLYAGLDPTAQSGQIWGVNDFWAVWESICLCHAAFEAGDDLATLLTCDFEHLPQGLSTDALEERWADWRKTTFARNDIHRRPDLVLDRQSSFCVVDFKYYREPTFRRPKWEEDAKLAKIERDFLNMEIYGLLLKNRLLSGSTRAASNIELEMWLPGKTHRLRQVDGSPGWEPALSIRTMPTVALVERYAALYGG